MDISHAIIAKSDQINADDLAGGPITVTIERVSENTAEQPYNVHISGHKPWRPCKTMLRVMAAAWGTDASKWVGKRITLYRDPKVKWANQEVGGIRISAMSGIARKREFMFQETRGKRAKFVVEKLEDAQPRERTIEEIREAIPRGEKALGDQLDAFHERLQLEPGFDASTLDDDAARTYYNDLVNAVKAAQSEQSA